MSLLFGIICFSLPVSINFVFYLCFLCSIHCTTVSSDQVPIINKTVLVSLLVRNKEHSLPYFLGYLEQLNYPKSQLALLIRCDHSIDKSCEIIQTWVKYWQPFYLNITYVIEHKSQGYVRESNPAQWTKERYETIIKYRQEALESGKWLKFDYVFFLDADVLILNSDTLIHLIAAKKTVVAPMINCTNSKFYSNFWGAMNTEGYYERSDNYIDILERKLRGLHKVAAVHSVYLIRLLQKISDNFISFLPPTSNYSGPIDDIVIFAQSAKRHGVNLFIDNKNFYGYFSQPTQKIRLSDEIEIFDHLKANIYIQQNNSDFQLTSSLALEAPRLPPKTNLGLDAIYVIHLKRRKERRERLQHSLSQLGLDVKFVEAVDGLQLNDSFLSQNDIRQLPGYYDPYHKRPLKYGEIGCFLSHYQIWKEMVKYQLDKVLVLEDDVDFQTGFISGIQNAIREANIVQPDWDFMYVGRKIMDEDESYVRGKSGLVRPAYSHWTLGYLLTLSGATKLLAPMPLQKMMAIDEYIPLMYNQQPVANWTSHFEKRDLIALAIYPSLVKPMLFKGQPGWLSDTELSSTIKINNS